MAERHGRYCGFGSIGAVRCLGAVNALQAMHPFLWGGGKRDRLGVIRLSLGFVRV